MRGKIGQLKPSWFDSNIEVRMNDHAKLDTVCPNNHNLTVSFTREEFESALKAGELVFHCNTCEANWPPSKDEIEKIREQFAEHK